MALSEGSVTRNLGRLKAGDDAAALVLWQRYFRRLVKLARRKLSNGPGGAADDEDVALDAFARFCRRAQDGRFPEVRNREDLWRLLVTLTVRMAIDHMRHEGRQKRGGGVAADAGPEQVASAEPTPAFVAEVAEECGRLLRALDDEELQSIAVWKTEGYTNEEIAAKLGCVLRTVERKVRAIRSRWSQEPPDGPPEGAARH